MTLGTAGRLKRLAGTSAVGMLLLLPAFGFAESGTNTVIRTVELGTTDLMIFTGVITTVDPLKYALTVSGHEVVVKRVKEAVIHGAVQPGRPAASRKKEPAPPAVSVTFQVPPACRIVVTNHPTAMLANLQSGEQVDVGYRLEKDGTHIATDISPPSEHKDEIEKVNVSPTDRPLGPGRHR